MDRGDNNSPNDGNYKNNYYRDRYQGNNRPSGQRRDYYDDRRPLNSSYNNRGYKDDYNSYERIPDLEYITRSEQYRKPQPYREPTKRYRDDSKGYFNPNKEKHIPADPNNTIGVFGFNQYTTDEEVKTLLKEKLPNINGYSYKLIMDERTGLCKGFCFVDFKCLEDAINAKNILSFESFRGQDFKCDFSYKQGIVGESPPKMAS